MKKLTHFDEVNFNRAVEVTNNLKDTLSPFFEKLHSSFGISVMQTESLQGRAIKTLERVAALMQIIFFQISSEFEFHLCEALFLDVLTNDSVLTKHQIIKRVERLFELTGNDDLCRETLCSRLNKFDDISRPLKDVNKSLIQFFQVKYGFIVVNREMVIKHGTESKI